MFVNFSNISWCHLLIFQVYFQQNRVAGGSTQQILVSTQTWRFVFSQQQNSEQKEYNK